MFLKITLVWLILLPAFMKAQKQTESENNLPDDEKYPKKSIAPRSIYSSNKGKSFSALSLELAKLHLIQQTLQLRSSLNSFAEEVNEHSPDKCTRIKKVGDPIVHHHSGNAQGAWMRDPTGILGPQKIWYMNSYYGNKLLEFDTMAEFKAGVISKTYNLPYTYDGTGSVVYGRYLYYNRAGTKNIIQYDLVTESVIRQKYPYSSIVARKYKYQWGGYNTLDLSIDESGLWVLFGHPSYSGKLCASQLDPLTLNTLRTYCSISSEVQTSMGNAFVSCGVVYMIDSYTGTTTINYAYDTATGQRWNPNIQFKNKFGYNSMVTYNPREKVLYAWDRNRQVTYPLEFEKPT